MITNWDLQKRYEETQKNSKFKKINILSKYQKSEDLESMKKRKTQRIRYMAILNIV